MSAQSHADFDKTLAVPKGRATMKDIANKLGVSINTVHKALTGKAGVGDEMRKKILATAEELGYQRNENASKLRRKVLNIVVLLPSADKTGSYFYAYLWKGCRQYAAEGRDLGLSFEAMDFPHGSYLERLDEVITRLNAGAQIDGLIGISPTNDDEVERLTQIVKAGVVVELLDGDHPETGRFGSVIPNYEAAGLLMAEQAGNLLSGKPGAKVLLLSGDPYSDSHYLVARAFHRYMASNCPELAVEDLTGAHAQYDEVRQALSARLQAAEKPDLLCSVFAVGTELIADTLDELGQACRVKAIGNDLFPESVLALQKGVFTNLVYKNPVGIAYQAAETLGKRLLWGETSSTDVQVGPVELVFRSNLEQYKAAAYLD